MPFNDNQYRAIELAVAATGQAGVAALAAEVQKLENKIHAETAALAAGGPVTQKAIDDLAKLKDKLDGATEAAEAATRVIQGLPAKLSETGFNAQAASRGVLALSRGLEDLATGGFLGILNNIPGIFRSIGQVAKLTAPQVAVLEASASLLGTAFYEVYQNFGRIKAAFGSGNAFGQLPNDVEGLKAKLEELNAIKVKTAVDYRDIEIATEKLHTLTEAESEYNRVKNKKSKAQQEASERATKAFVEYGGGDDSESSIDNVAALAARLTKPADSSRTANLAKQLEQTRAAAASPANAMGASSLHFDIARLETELKQSRETDQIKHQEAIRNQVGLAAGGKANQVDWLLNLLRNNQEAVDRAGIGPGFVQGLGGASRGRVERDLYEKSNKADEKASEAAVEHAISESAAETAKAVAEAVRSVKGGVDDALVKKLFDAIKSGMTPADAQKQARGGLLDTLRSRGVNDYHISAAADSLLDTASDTAQNLISEGDLPKLDKQVATAQRKADAEHQRAINEAASRTAGGYRDEAEAAIFRDAQAGHNLDRSIDRERPLLEKALRDRGNLDPAIVGDVASQILAKAREAALNAIDSGQAPKLIRDADHARHAEAKKIEAGFLPGAEAMIAQNQLRAEMGAPVAHSRRQIQMFERQGIPYALDEQGARQFVEAEVARNLKASHQDPGLAHDVTAKAFEDVNQAYVKGMAEVGSGVGSLMQVIQNAQGQIGSLQRQLSGALNGIDQLKKNNAELSMRSQRLGVQARETMQQRPSLIQY